MERKFAVKDPKRTKTKDERFSIPNAPEESNVPVPDLLTSKNGSVSKRNKPGSRGIWKRLSGIFRKSGNKGDPCSSGNKDTVPSKKLESLFQEEGSFGGRQDRPSLTNISSTEAELLDANLSATSDKGPAAITTSPLKISTEDLSTVEQLKSGTLSTKSLASSTTRSEISSVPISSDIPREVLRAGSALQHDLETQSLNKQDAIQEAFTMGNSGTKTKQEQDEMSNKQRIPTKPLRRNSMSENNELQFDPYLPHATVGGFEYSSPPQTTAPSLEVNRQHSEGIVLFENRTASATSTCNGSPELAQSTDSVQIQEKKETSNFKILHDDLTSFLTMKVTENEALLLEDAKSSTLASEYTSAPASINENKTLDHTLKLLESARSKLECQVTDSNQEQNEVGKLQTNDKEKIDEQVFQNLQVQKEEIHTNPSSNSNTFLDKLDDVCRAAALAKHRDLLRQPMSDIERTKEEIYAMQNLYENIDKIKTALRCNAQSKIEKSSNSDEKTTTYAHMENDIQGMISELLMQSSEIKESVLNSIITDNDKTPAITFSVPVHNSKSSSKDDVRWILDIIMEQIEREVGEKYHNNLGKHGDVHAETSRGNGGSSVKDRVTELGSLKPVNEKMFTTTQQYFCTTSLNSDSKVPKTSWSFGESQLSNTNRRNQDSGGIPSGSSGGKRAYNSEQIMCILKRNKYGRECSKKSSFPKMFRSPKCTNITKQYLTKTKAPNPFDSAAEEVILYNTFLTMEDVSSSTSKGAVRKRKINETSSKASATSKVAEGSIPSPRTYVTSSSSEEIVRPYIPQKDHAHSIHDLRKPKSPENDDVTTDVATYTDKPLKPMPKVANFKELFDVKDAETSGTPPHLQPSANYEGSYEGSELVSSGYRSLQELNTREEVLQIEKNVRQNEVLERRGCMVLKRPVLYFDMDSSCSVSEYSA